MDGLNDLTVVKQKKSHKGIVYALIAIVCLAAAIAGGIVAYKALDKKYKDENKEQVEEKKEEEKKDNNIEKDITNQNVLKEIRANIFPISKIGLVNLNHEVGSIFETEKELKRNDISSEDKLIGLIHSLESKKDSFSKADTEIIERYYEAVFETNEDYEMGGLFYTIDASKLKEMYKNLYDEELKSFDTDIMYPTIFYDEKTDKILIDYENAGGLGKLSEQVETFIYKTTEDDENVYVYIAAGLKTYDEYDYMCTYYYDTKGTNKYSEIPCDSETIVSIINIENYQEFNNFKITFNKKGNNYIFSSIKRIDAKNSFELDSDKKFIITTDSKYSTMQNDGGSHTNVYYQIDLESKSVTKLEDRYIGFEGYKYQGKITGTKTLTDSEKDKLKKIIDEAIAKKDETKDDTSYMFYTLDSKDEKEVKIVDKSIIDELNNLLNC